MPHVVVIGAGITGVTSAYELIKLGYEVTVIDRHLFPAMETSFANGGQLSACNAEVWNQKATVLKGIKWMSKKDAPLLLNPSFSVHKYRWLVEFLTHIKDYKVNTIETVRLALLARQRLFEIAEKENIAFDLSDTRKILRFIPLKKENNEFKFERKDMNFLFEEPFKIFTYANLVLSLFFMIEILVLFVVGIGVGTFGTLIGIGGGLIMIPLFTFALTPSIFHSAPEIVGTSLFGVFLNALSGTYAYVKQHRVYFKAAIPFAIATLPGAILGSLVSDYFTGPTFSLSYGIFILIISAIMYWNSSNKKAIATNFDETLFIARKKLGIILSMFVGFISSIFGIGGGIIHVPVMIYALAFPPHMATATSHFVLAV